MAPTKSKQGKIKIKGFSKKELAGRAAKAKEPQPVVRRLDDGAVKWLRLLNDPCNADLAEPCYGSSGTGYLSRQKVIFAPPVAARDYVLEFTPTFGASDAYRYGWSDGTGVRSLGTAARFSAGGLVTNSGVVGRARCVAACMRLVYTGTELAREGTVSMYLSSGATLSTGEAIVGTAFDFHNSAPRVARVGSEDHEIKWCPNEHDQSFQITDGAVSEEVGTGSVVGNSITISVFNVPTNTTYVECVAVWEWQPVEEVTGARSVSTLKSPPSSMPFNDVIRQLGNLGKWATSGKGGTLVGMAANAAMPYLKPVYTTLKAIGY